MSTEKDHKEKEAVQEIEAALTKTERYIEENQKSLVIIIAAIVLIIGGYLAYQKFYVGTEEKEAQRQMFMAERYFDQDSFKLVLNGDGNYLGVLKIIDKYSVTKSANLAQYYAGISSLHLGKWDDAIKYLKGFDSKDKVISTLAIGGIGDAYLEKGDAKEALSYYEKAISNADNNSFATPVYMYKAALVSEDLKDLAKAQKLYQDIIDFYPQSAEARKAEKDVARVKMNAPKS
jgi:tetratricopeptide (TPR) repeat protein